MKGAFGVVLYLALVGLVEAGSPLRFTKNGTLPSGKPFSVVISERRFVKGPGAQPDDGSIWGIDGGFPTNVVNEFSVLIEGKPILIPRKYLADISNLYSVDVRAEKDLVVILLKGGDAAGSFSAEYRVHLNGSLVRIIRHGEVPDEHWEKTEFRVDFPEDM
jgi:hypothetical protein